MKSLFLIFLFVLSAGPLNAGIFDIEPREAYAKRACSVINDPERAAVIFACIQHFNPLDMHIAKALNACRYANTDLASVFNEILANLDMLLVPVFGAYRPPLVRYYEIPRQMKGDDALDVYTGEAITSIIKALLKTDFSVDEMREFMAKITEKIPEVIKGLTVEEQLYQIKKLIKNRAYES